MALPLLNYQKSLLYFIYQEKWPTSNVLHISPRHDLLTELQLCTLQITKPTHLVVLNLVVLPNRGQLATGCLTIAGQQQCFPGNLSTPVPCSLAPNGYITHYLDTLLSSGQGADGDEGSLCTALSPWVCTSYAAVHGSGIHVCHTGHLIPESDPKGMLQDGT